MDTLFIACMVGLMLALLALIEFLNWLERK